MVCARRRVGGFQCRKLACFLCGLDFLSVGFVLEDVLFCVDTMGKCRAAVSLTVVWTLPYWGTTCVVSWALVTSG